MKYGVLEYKNPHCINIGDSMQIISVINIYHQMGIEEDELVKIDFYELDSYDGEQVVLPICFPFYGLNKNNRIISISQKIIPIFLSLSLLDAGLTEKELQYLKKCEPIGCRDEFTAEALSKKGIKAYLSGCMTLTLSAKFEANRQKKIYCIDLPREFYKFIPENLKNDIFERTHIFRNVTMGTIEYAQKLLEEYATTAKMVITSRLHAALPCYAIGLPVIFIHNAYSYRFAWMEDLLPVYLPSEWQNIEWNGHVISENKVALQIRQLMTEIAKKRIERCETPDSEIQELQLLYGARGRRPYIREPIDLSIQFINSHWQRDTQIRYAVWGVSQVASALIDYIKAYYPSAKLGAVIDARKTKPFKNCLPTPVEQTDGLQQMFVFVTADAVNPYAISYFKKIEKNPATYFFCWQHIKMEIGELSS